MNIFNKNIHNFGDCPLNVINYELSFYSSLTDIDNIVFNHLIKIKYRNLINNVSFINDKYFQTDNKR